MTHALIPFADAPAKTGVSERVLRRLRANRELEFVKIGSKLYLDPDEWDTFVERHREPATRNDRPQAGRSFESLASTTGHHNREAGYLNGSV